MKSDGYRSEYPIVIDENAIIDDGERRWRAAKEAGIKQVPVEVRKNITDYERLMYQLQSEGAELEDKDRYEAWVKAYDLGAKYGNEYKDVAKLLGVNVHTFTRSVNEYKGFLNLKKENVAATFEDNYGALSEIQRVKDPKVRKTMAKKSIKEKWSRDKAREINRAIKEKPLRQKQILDQDYSDPYEGSSQWKARLEVAKSDLDIEVAQRERQDYERKEEIVSAYDDIIYHGLRMKAAMGRFDYTAITPKAVTAFHQEVQKFFPFAVGYIEELEAYMIESGFMDKNHTALKGGDK